MNVDHLDVHLVPREPTEAQDLGLQLLRKHAGVTFGAVFLVMSPIWALSVFLGSASLWGGWLAVWWSKPLMDRVAIHVLSRAAFGAAPTILQTVAAVPGMIDRPLIALLTWRRFEFRRSLWFPVASLEGLRGKDLGERYAAIKYGKVAREGTVSTIVFMHIEWALAFGALGLAVWMLPDDWLPDFWSMVIGDFSATSRYQWLSLVTWLPCLLICEVAYAAAGFGLYISRRTELEGWNVELAFRRIGKRLGEMARRGVAMLLPLVLAGAVWLGPAGASSWQQGGDAAPGSTQALTEPGEIARDVLSHPDFDTTKEQTAYLPDFDLGGDGGGDPGLALFLMKLLKAAGWVLVGGILIALVVYIARHLETGRVHAKKVPAAPKPAEAFGLDLREASLPPDIVAAAKALALDGKIVASLSLLYRGALHRLMENDELEIFPGDTEHDCMRRVSGAVEEKVTPSAAHRASYFGSLTEHWITAAWGASPPGQSATLSLCDGWGDHFEVGPSSAAKGKLSPMKSVGAGGTESRTGGGQR